jgi:hypothetical protein
VLAAVLGTSGILAAKQIPVRYSEGNLHGFLVLRDLKGKTLAAGDLTQVIRGGRVVDHLVFHFKDGSIDDEKTTFTQDHHFRLLSDDHVQKGPIFPHPMDVRIDATSGEVTVRFKDDGKDKVQKHHVDLPPDLANGLIPTLLRDIHPDAPETEVSYLAATPKPRLVKLDVSPQGEDRFSVAGSHYKATRYVIKTKIGGIAGIVAPLIGKQPQDIDVWILGGSAPAFVKLKGQLYQGGPLWVIELSSPVWH